ncbi:HVM60 protein, partial [Polyodon spathula]|nr:HVM60 protein [Polyodon spathula]
NVFDCFLLSFFTELLASQLVLQSQKAIVAPAWSSTVLHCSVNGAAMSSYTMLWYRQQPSGKAIEFICDEFARYGQGFADRFEMTHSSSENQFILGIRNLTSEDTGTYYCA